MGTGGCCGEVGGGRLGGHHGGCHVMTYMHDMMYERKGGARRLGVCFIFVFPY